MANTTRQPSGDVAVGNWGTAPLWSKVNEGSGAPDATYIVSPNNSNTTCELSVQDPNPAGTYTQVEVKVYARKDAAAGNQRGLDADIRINAGLQGQKTQQVNLDAAWTEYSQTWAGLSFTKAQMASLQVSLISTGTTGGPGGNRREVWIDYCELILTYTPGGGVKKSSIVILAGAKRR
ncbi:MAG: hypothetical protein KAR06_02970 [Deltaproteobacteria bacterium]|nr:hypothetical protein [Deltaproteobacteria bacterium]